MEIHLNKNIFFFFLIAVGQEVANYSISNSLGGGVLFI